MSELRFDGRVALVTGAGRGMGRAHALLLASRGAKVIVNDVGVMMDGHPGTDDPAREVVEEIRRAGGEAIADKSNVAEESGANHMVEAAIKAFGRLDIVVHNAGIATFIPFGDMSYAQFREVVAVHTDGGFLVAKAAWPHMVRQKYGRLIFITSQAALSGLAHLAHYAVAKTGLTGLARVIGLEGETHGIRANTLGVTAYTRMMESLFTPSDIDRPDAGMVTEAQKWWQQYMRPELTSAVVGWLAHEDCDLNGQTLDTGGGRVSHQLLIMTQGYSKIDLTPENVRDNQACILNQQSGLHHFKNVLEFLAWQAERVCAGGAPPAPAL